MRAPIPPTASAAGVTDVAETSEADRSWRHFGDGGRADKHARTSRATFWRFGGSFIGGLLQFIVSIPLARLLNPADFGVVALTNVVLTFAQPFADLGLANALVQRSNVSDRHVRTAFTMAAMLGAAIGVLLIVAAPLAVSLTGTPAVASVLRILAPGFACRAAAGVAEALLRRSLDFKRQVIIEIAAYLVGYGVVAIGLAWNGYGLWSLVWGSLVQMVVAAAAQMAVVRHSIRPLLGRPELSQLVGFGVGASLSSVFNYLAINGDDFIVGRVLGATSLGLYSRAYGLMKLPHIYVGTVMTRVMFPVFADAQHDQARLQRGYLLLTEVTATVAAPALATLAVVAPYMVPSVYGPQWTGVVTPLEILCVAGYFRALYHLGGVVAQSVGRVYDELWRQMVYAVLVIVAVFAGTSHGLTGVAIAVVVATVYMFIAAAGLALGLTGTSWRRYLRAQFGAFAIAAVTASAALAARRACEAYHASAVATTLGMLGAAAVPWVAGALWTVARSAPLRALLPDPAATLIDSVFGRHPK
jgi:PST family polysaccharide transporter